MFSLVMVLASAASAQDIERKWLTHAELDVDPAGQVVAAKFPADIPDVLAKAASETLSHWRYRPIQKDGHPVNAKTHALVTLRMVKRDDGTFGLQVVYRSNGPLVHHDIAPRYPLAQTSHAEGALLIEAVVRPDGRIDNIQVVEAHFNGPLSNLFSKFAVEAVKKWHADPEYVDGQPIATRIQIPISFCLGRDGCRDKPPVLKLWHKPAAMTASLPPLSDEAIALDSPLAPASVATGG